MMNTNDFIEFFKECYPEEFELGSTVVSTFDKDAAYKSYGYKCWSEFYEGFSIAENMGEKGVLAIYIMLLTEYDLTKEFFLELIVNIEVKNIFYSTESSKKKASIETQKLSSVYKALEAATLVFATIILKEKEKDIFLKDFISFLCK